MKYEKNQYTSGFNVCGLIIAGAFFYWGISTLVQNSWGVGWIGFIWLGIGVAILSSQLRAIANRKNLRNIVKQEFEANPNVSQDEIHEKTGISRKDIQAIVLDLKGSGELKGSFSTETGKFVVPQTGQASQEKRKFCPSCGTSLKSADVKFCEFCGSKVSD